jgi:hypothetical protein
MWFCSIGNDGLLQLLVESSFCFVSSHTLVVEPRRQLRENKHRSADDDRPAVVTRAQTAEVTVTDVGGADTTASGAACEAATSHTTTIICSSGGSSKEARSISSGAGLSAGINREGSARSSSAATGANTMRTDAVRGNDGLSSSASGETTTAVAKQPHGQQQRLLLQLTRAFLVGLAFPQQLVTEVPTGKYRKFDCALALPSLALPLRWQLHGLSAVSSLLMSFSSPPCGQLCGSVCVQGGLWRASRLVSPPT